MLVQLETRAAVDALEAIAAVDGVDAIFIGPSDLAASLGYLGNNAHPEVRSTIEQACRRGGDRKADRHPRADREERRAYLDMGFAYVAVGSDVVVLRKGCDALVKMFKGSLRRSRPMSAETKLQPVSLFYSYAHEDDLGGAVRSPEDPRAAQAGLAVARSADQAGEDWNQQISDELQMADLVLLLVSTDFINSDYIFGKELTIAMQRHAAGMATVVPIIIRAVNIESEDADAFPFMKLQGHRRICGR